MQNRTAPLTVLVFWRDSISYCFTVLFPCSENICAQAHAGPAVLASQQGFGFLSLGRIWSQEVNIDSQMTSKWQSQSRLFFIPLYRFLGPILWLIRNVTSRDWHRPTCHRQYMFLCILRNDDKSMSTVSATVNSTFNNIPVISISWGINHDARLIQCVCTIRTIFFSQNYS